MLQVRGRVGGTTLAGTLYERGERVPSFTGAPNDGVPAVRMRDAFSGGRSGRLNTAGDLPFA